MASKQKAFAATFWSGADIFLRQGVQFLVSLALARILSPADFGLIALLTFFNGMAMVFVQSGMNMAIIRNQNSRIEEESSVFWFNMAISLLCAGLLVFIAPMIARFFTQPVLEPLMYFTAPQMVLAASASVQDSLMQRTLRFRELLLVGGISAVISGIVGVILALTGYGVWALAWQLLTSTTTTTVLIWRISGWRPIMRFDFAYVCGLLRFGNNLTLAAVLAICYEQGISAIIGKFYGMEDLGLFNRGSNVQGVAAGILTTLIGRVSLPLFSQRAEDGAALKRGIRFVLCVAMVANVPLMMMLAILSDSLIVVLFGESWRPAAPILTVLSLSGALFPIHVVNLQALLARGDSGTFLKLDVAKQSLGLIIVMIGSFFGVMGLAWSKVASSIICIPLNAAPNQRRLNYGALDQLRDLTSVFVVSAAMGAIVLLAKRLSLPPAFELLVLPPLGAAVYIGLGLGFRVPIFAEILSLAINSIPPAFDLPRFRWKF